MKQEQRTPKQNPNPNSNPNQNPKQQDDGVRDIIRKNLLTYFNAIFLVITILLIAARSYKSLTFLPVILANILIGIFQQLRAKKILDKLTLLTKAKYKVLRNQSEREISSDELLEGDILFLQSGQQIPADAKVTEGKISVNESLLTGESDEIEKELGSTLLSGSFVVSGS